MQLASTVPLQSPYICLLSVWGSDVLGPCWLVFCIRVACPQRIIKKLQNCCQNVSQKTLQFT